MPVIFTSISRDLAFKLGCITLSPLRPETWPTAPHLMLKDRLGTALFWALDDIMIAEFQIPRLPGH